MSTITTVSQHSGLSTQSKVINASYNLISEIGNIVN